MNRFVAIVILFTSLTACLAATTINHTAKYAYSANVAWMDWRGDGTNGAVIGEYVCSGYIWSASVGWIHLGDKTPANGNRPFELPGAGRESPRIDGQRMKTQEKVIDTTGA